MHRFLLPLLIAVALPLSAAEISLIPRLSTLGAGVDLRMEMTPRTAIRAGAGMLTLERPVTWKDIDFDGEVDIRTASLMLDLNPAANGFRITGGGIWNDNVLTGRSNENTTIEINGVRYPVALVGRVEGLITTDALGPYLGLGWTSRTDRRIRLDIDVGGMYHGRPAVELFAIPHFGIPLPQRYLDDIEAEEREIEEEISRYRVLPVVSIGVVIRLQD